MAVVYTRASETSVGFAEWRTGIRTLYSVTSAPATGSPVASRTTPLTLRALAATVIRPGGMLPTSRKPTSASRARARFHVEAGVPAGSTTYRSDEGDSSLNRITTNGAIRRALRRIGEGRPSWNATAP